MDYPSIVIAGVMIRQDHEGRFYLNDLHRASGGEKRHQPSNWLTLRNTQELAALINERTGKSSIMSRQGLGTFVSKELVYSYAMWVSPQFNLQVIEVYDQLVTQTKQQNVRALPDFNDPVQAARAWADEVERVRKLSAIAIEQKEHLKAAAPAMEFHRAVSASEDNLTVGQYAKLMGVGEVNFFRMLRHDKVLITGGTRHNLPYQNHLDVDRFKVIERVVRDHSGRDRLICQTRITPKGQMWLQKKYFPQQTSDQRILTLDQETPSQQLDRAMDYTTDLLQSERAGFRRLARSAATEPQPSERAYRPVVANAAIPPLEHPDQDVEASRHYYQSMR